MLEYWLWLTGRRGVGLRGLRALLEQFGTPEAVYCAAEQDYPQALRPEGRASLADKELAPARQILQQCYRKNIHVLTFQDAAYPNRLRKILTMRLWYCIIKAFSRILTRSRSLPWSARARPPRMDFLQAKRLGYQLGRYGAASSSPAVRPGSTPWRFAAPYPPERRLLPCLPAVWMSTIRP